MIVDNIEILPISLKNESYPAMRDVLTEMINEYKHLSLYPVTHDLAHLIIDNKNNKVYLKKRRYDVVEESIWRLECGSMIETFKELGYTFFYESQISN
jgi:hypothetical protein